MVIGIQSNLWGTEQHGESLPSILSDIAEAGYAGIEIGAHRFKDLDHPYDFLELVKRNDLHVAGIHTIGRLYFDGNLDYVEKAADFTKALDSKYMMVSGDSSTDKTFAELQKTAKVLNRAGEICRDRGIFYCYHNHAFEFVNEGDEFRSLCDLTDPQLVSLCLDIGWVERGGQSPLAVTKEYFDRIRYLHIKDTLGDKFVNLGEGTVEIPGLIDLIKNRNGVYLTVELDEVMPDSLESAKKCREYLRGIGL